METQLTSVQRPPKRYSLDHNQLKYILICAMLIDHLASAFVPTLSVAGQLMHIIGRLTGPAMSLLIAEGYQYTRNRKKYALRLFIFALISWPAYSLNSCREIDPTCLGMIYTLFLAFITVWMWDKLRVPKALKIVFVILLCGISLLGDWPIFAILWALFGFIYRERPKAKWISFIIIAVLEATLAAISSNIWYSQLYQFGALLVPLLMICCYNGQKGSSAKIHKWFFYIFYPAHLLILWAVRTYLM